MEKTDREIVEELLLSRGAMKYLGTSRGLDEANQGKKILFIFPTNKNMVEFKDMIRNVILSNPTRTEFPTMYFHSGEIKLVFSSGGEISLLVLGSLEKLYGRMCKGWMFKYNPY